MTTNKRNEILQFALKNGWQEQNLYQAGHLFLERFSGSSDRMTIAWTSTRFERIDHALVHGRNEYGSSTIRRLTGGLPAIKRYLKEN